MIRFICRSSCRYIDRKNKRKWKLFQWYD